MKVYDVRLLIDSPGPSYRRLPTSNSEGVYATKELAENYLKTILKTFDKKDVIKTCKGFSFSLKDNSYYQYSIEEINVIEE